MAQKFITRSDLDLLLTEYYKERLKSRLKNRETHKIDYLLTEYISTKLTDFSSNIKFLPAKSFPLTLPLLLLSLPHSVNPSILLASFHNLSHLYFDSVYKVILHHSTITSSSVARIEPSLKQGGKGKVTLIESVSSKDSLKDPSSTSIPIYFRAVMPSPDLPGDLYFEGSNITNFFNSYSRMCINYQVDKQKKIKRLSWYCELFIGKYIETLIRFFGPSWAALQKTLREEYKD